MSCQHSHNEDAPRQVLGLVKKTWKITELKGILDHYGIKILYGGCLNTWQDIYRESFKKEQSSNIKASIRRDARKGLSEMMHRHR